MTSTPWWSAHQDPLLGEAPNRRLSSVLIASTLVAVVRRMRRTPSTPLVLFEGQAILRFGNAVGGR